MINRILYRFFGPSPATAVTFFLAFFIVYLHHKVKVTETLNGDDRNWKISGKAIQNKVNHLIPKSQISSPGHNIEDN